MLAQEVLSAHQALVHPDPALQEQPVMTFSSTDIQICVQQVSTSVHLPALNALMTTTAPQVFTILLSVPLVPKA